MAKQLWKTGTGNYPNNVVNYLLNTSPMHYVRIPTDNKDMRLLWQNVTKTLPQFIKDTIELVFDEQLTLKQTAYRTHVSPTTTRRVIRRLHSWLNKDGFAMQQLYNYAVRKGYVYTIDKNDILKAHKLFMSVEDITEAEAMMFYTYLQNGLLINEIHKLIGVRTAVLMRLYNKAVELNMEKMRKKVKDEN